VTHLLLSDRTAKIELMLAGNGEIPGSVARIFLLDQRLHLVYCILGGLAAWAGGTLRALLVEK
jgi:hypothetical protein